MMEKPTQIEQIKPTEGRREKTSLNLLKINSDSLSKIANERKITQTMAVDEAISEWVAKATNTTDIDSMIKETNGFLFERDLSVVKAMLANKVNKFGAYQIAHLYRKLKDKDDRVRVFQALGLVEPLKAIDEVNRILEKASDFNGSNFKGYVYFTLANEIRAELTHVQAEYLNMKIGIEAFEKLKERRPNIFPKLTCFTGEDREETFNEATINPALETVLAVTALSKATWKALPDSIKKQIHDAVKNGKLEIVKKLVSSIGDDSELVELFS